MDEDVSQQWLFAIGFPLGNLLLLAAVSIVLLRGAAQRLADPVTMLLAGMLVYAVSDLTFAAVRAHGQRATGDGAATTCLVVASLLMTVAAMRQATVPAGAAPQPQRPFPAWSTHLPLAAVGVAAHSYWSPPFSRASSRPEAF